MTLCVVIGDDPVGKYVADRIGQIPGACVIGLKGARQWLQPLVPAVEFVGILQFGRLRSLLQQGRVTEIAFAGGLSNSLRRPQLDQIAMRYLGRQLGLWIPYSYLQALQELLKDSGVTTRSVVDIFPELGMTASLIADRHREHDGTRDIDEALRHVKGTPLRRLRQSHIVDGGRLLMSGIRSNALLQKFGTSSVRHSASMPTLCKVAVFPFENVIPATIGEETARIAMDNGVAVIVVQSGRAIVMQKDRLSQLAAQDLLSVLVC